MTFHAVQRRLMFFFAVILGWLPTQGYVSLFEDPVEGVRHMILPAFALGITSCALIMRQTRSANSSSASLRISKRRAGYGGRSRAVTEIS